MRTTINLPDDLLGRAKKLAAESRTTLTALIEEGLRSALARRQRKTRARPASLPTYGVKGVQPGIDLDDSAALLDAMESHNGAARR